MTNILILVDFLLKVFFTGVIICDYTMPTRQILSKGDSHAGHQYLCCALRTVLMHP